MTARILPPGDAWYRSAAPKTGQTDDERIKDITVLPPPEHLIRFFPIQSTPVETLVSGTRQSIQRIMRNQDDRLLVIVGPCSIHNPRPRWTTPAAWPTCASNTKTRWKSSCGCILKNPAPPSAGKA